MRVRAASTSARSGMSVAVMVWFYHDMADSPCGRGPPSAYAPALEQRFGLLDERDRVGRCGLVCLVLCRAGPALLRERAPDDTGRASAALQGCLAAGDLRDDGALREVEPGPARVEHGVALRGVRQAPAQLVGEVGQDVGARDRPDEVAGRRPRRRAPGRPAYGVVHEQVTVSCHGPQAAAGSDHARWLCRTSHDVPQEWPRRAGFARGRRRDDAGLERWCAVLLRRMLGLCRGDDARHRISGRIVGLVCRHDSTSTSLRPGTQPPSTAEPCR